MTNAERASELKQLRVQLGDEDFRMNIRTRRETLGRMAKPN